MADKITKALVQKTFTTFIDVAKRAGFDTDRWVLQEGDRYTGWAHFERGTDGHRLYEAEFRAYLGGNIREAYATLTARIHTLQAVLELQRQQSTRE